MPGLTVVRGKYGVDRVDHHEGIEPVDGSYVSPVNGMVKDRGKILAQQLQAIQVVLGDWDSKKRTIRYEFAERLTGAQRVSFDVTNGRVDQAHC